MRIWTAFISVLISAVAAFGIPAGGLSASAQAVASPAREADAPTELVLIGYEPWFGPEGVYYGNAPHFPVLTSKSTSRMGIKGYDSADPMIIDQHSSWLVEAGVDALLLDHSNGTACTFGDLTFCSGNSSASAEQVRVHYTKIRENVSAIYERLSETGSRLRIVPLLGAAEPDALTPNNDGETSLDKEVRFYLALHERFPERSVVYEGKPLFTVFVGAAQSLDPAALWRRVLDLMNSTYSDRVTTRVVAGYVGQQPHLLKPSPAVGVLRESSVPIWSWIERLNPAAGILPSFTVVGSRAEAFTVQLTSPPINVNGLEDWKSPEGRYHSEIVPRNDGQTFRAFMALAQQINPIFLIVNQWNCFCAGSDGGVDYETSNDFEPSTVGGSANYNLLREQIYRYRQRLPPELPP